MHKHPEGFKHFKGKTFHSRLFSIAMDVMTQQRVYVIYGAEDTFENVLKTIREQVSVL